jgi:hypothetical protein
LPAAVLPQPARLGSGEIPQRKSQPPRRSVQSNLVALFYVETEAK